jgi:hypothetical protein
MQKRNGFLGAIVVVIIFLILCLLVYIVTQKLNNDNSETVDTAQILENNNDIAAPDTTWIGTVSLNELPLGDDNVSTSPKIGYTYSCTTNFKGGGARHAGDWINTAANTWDATKKVTVQGSILWPAAKYSSTSSTAARTLTTNGLPNDSSTGEFPIAKNDPAYQYDTNPNAIGYQNLTYTLPLNPAAASTPNCLPQGVIGIMDNGVALFSALDAAGRDAVAHETQDTCAGHPNGQEIYHYHDVSECINEGAKSSSQLVGYALDGFGIYVERDSKGNLPTNADLDECHGRVSEIMWNGEPASIYHYSASNEYPYVIGCLRGSYSLSDVNR